MMLNGGSVLMPLDLPFAMARREAHDRRAYIQCHICTQAYLHGSACKEGRSTQPPTNRTNFRVINNLEELRPLAKPAASSCSISSITGPRGDKQAAGSPIAVGIPSVQCSDRASLLIMISSGGLACRRGIHEKLAGV